MSSTDNPPEGRREDEPTGTPLEGVRAAGTATGESGGSGARTDTTTGAEESGDAGLAPIPPEGTVAPPDAERVFGRPRTGSPYSRIMPTADSSGGGGAGEGGNGPEGARPGGTPQGGSRPGGGWGVPTGGWSGGTGGPGGPGRPGGPGGLGGPGGQPGGAHGPAESEDQRRQVNAYGRFALMLGIFGLLASIFVPPLGIFAGGIAVWLGVAGRRRGRRAGRAVPGAGPGLVLGVVAVAIGLVLSVVWAVFWNEIVDYQECVSGANTQTARQNCQTTFEKSIFDRLSPPSRP
ncbi:hypothetical protein [Actinopolymorpha singaporensis]|uniref:DUF4190 domain-containing protein n=1 Tax=Actinopolymorpha singaporensis TaxID=117157 RepID=A0A1H1SJ96_9ACTN|nr:hypothetical protein [Actinopolymorpha singaporensis]SDS48094.1 hypothetical protein SAMN04489717_2829 [Actinopolymorpha singaporensis]